MKGYIIILDRLLIILSVFVFRIDASQSQKNSMNNYSLKTGGAVRVSGKPLVGEGSLESEEYSEEIDYENEYEEEKETIVDILAGLKHKLGVPHKNKVFRSSKKNEEKNIAETEVNSLVVCSLVTSKNSASQPMKVCLPNSLEKCRKENQIKETQINAQSDATCDVNIPEYKGSLEKLGKKLMEDSELFLKYKKGTWPPTMDPTFRKAATKLAEKHLISEKNYDNFLAKIAILKCYLNDHLVDYAVTISTLARKDCSSDIPNPIEVDDVYFNKAHKPQERGGGNDYNLFMLDGHHKILGDGNKNKVQLSGDPKESKLDYHREDSMFHAFHALFHRIFDSLLQRRYKRTFELFFYTHQQMMRRTAIERHVNGLKPVVPLDPTEFRKPLGPGYNPGWYAWPGLGGRKDDCEIKNFNTSYIDIVAQKYAEVQSNMNEILNFEEFGQSLEKWYHTSGHTFIAKACSTIFDVANDTGMGVMSFSEVSGRDPIFYRWHTHIEEIVQQFRDMKMARYTTGDFKLSDGVEVVGVNTLIGKEIAATDKDVKNLLITHWEHKEIRHDQETTISYNRLNHLDFKYQIRIKNENQVQRKVFIRLWLGILMDKNGLKTHDPKYMIEMDQFAHTLSGSADEVIERLSVQSAVTMKDIGTTVSSLMEDIELKKANRTWCGYPHNLLVPRSGNYKPEQEGLGGNFFVLMAFVTNTQHDVIAGSDGVEHMLCGHKDLNTTLDRKSFGFPFDRKISFRLKTEANYVAMSEVQIIYRPEQYNQKDMGEKLDMMQTTSLEEIEDKSEPKTVFQPPVTEATPIIRDQLSSRERKHHTVHHPMSEPTIMFQPPLTDATLQIIYPNSDTKLARRETDQRQIHDPESETTTLFQPPITEATPLSIDPNQDNEEDKLSNKEKIRKKKRTWDDVWKMLLQLLKEKPDLANQWLNKNKQYYTK